MLIGYARVSTVDQNLELQTEALTKAGCKKMCLPSIGGFRPQATLSVLRCPFSHGTPISRERARKCLIRAHTSVQLNRREARRCVPKQS